MRGRQDGRPYAPIPLDPVWQTLVLGVVPELAQMLILMLGFGLFRAFVQLHRKSVWLGKMTAKTLAQELNLALEADLPWEPWFACGSGAGGDVI